MRFLSTKYAKNAFAAPVGELTDFNVNMELDDGRLKTIRMRLVYVCRNSGCRNSGCRNNGCLLTASQALAHTDHL